METKINTQKEVKNELIKCRDIFSKKLQDYGTSWRIMRPSSVTDQIYIKARRIRSFEEKGEFKIQESISSEYQAIINYCIIALIILELNLQSSIMEDIDLKSSLALTLYDKYTNRILNLLEAKNHDYDEAWRHMRISSFTDIILQKLLRTKEIESNHGKTIVSEGVDANYMDIVNYALFALIKLNEQVSKDKGE